MKALCRYIYIAIVLLTGHVSSASPTRVPTNSHQPLIEVFNASVDSFRHCYIDGRLNTARLWADAAFRSICDSDTYYGYKGIESFLRVADGNLKGTKDNVISVIKYFNDRSDTFGIGMIAIAYTSLGSYMLATDYEKSITYFDLSIRQTERISDTYFRAFNVLLKGEAYYRSRNLVDAAQCSREVLRFSDRIKTLNILRFMSQASLYKIYAQMHANTMVDYFGEKIENEKYYQNSLTLEARYLLRKADYLISISKLKEAEDCSTRLLQACELTGTNLEKWNIHLQAAKIQASLGNIDDAQTHVDYCKKQIHHIDGLKYTPLYSAYHLKLIEAWIAYLKKQYSQSLAIVQNANFPDGLINSIEFGNAYYKLLERIYLSLGDYKNAVNMVKASDKLRDEAYEVYSRQRAIDQNNMFSNDTTILNQSVMLAMKNQDLTKAQNKAIIGILIIIAIVLTIVVIQSAITRYQRREKERLNIEKKKNLEKEITQQTKTLRTQKEEISKRNLDIMLSQSYAQVIQNGVLPDPSELNFKEITGSFIIYKPVDMVSGDFYWFRKFDDNIVVCCADCSGHGVPGAMMTMVGLTLLSDITRNRETFVASELLEDLDSAMQNMMPDIRRSDSMNASIVIINTKEHKINISLAHQNMILKIAGDVIHITGDLRRVGYAGSRDKFNDAFYDYNKGDSFYLYTDGVYALPGGVYGDKLTPKRFMEIISKSLSESIENRDSKIQHALATWLDGNEQVDDYSIVGIEL